MKPAPQREGDMIKSITKKLADEGKIIEAGWIGLKMMSVPKDAGETQLREMRNAFFAGAQHLFSSILTMLDSGPNETEADLSRMDLIDKELRSFIKEFKEQTFT